MSFDAECRRRRPGICDLGFQSHLRIPLKSTGRCSTRRCVFAGVRAPQQKPDKGTVPVPQTGLAREADNSGSISGQRCPGTATPPITSLDARKPSEAPILFVSRQCQRQSIGRERLPSLAATSPLCRFVVIPTPESLELEAKGSLSARLEEMSARFAGRESWFAWEWTCVTGEPGRWNVTALCSACRELQR